ncbi:MAG: dihydrofolate reductase [Oscillospiraceae bacterium]|jgi:dihydrofolate reductase|nr:dihydrofolate reductase [Oscillospiraceae bacterium]
MTVIAAIDRNNAIGRENRLLFRLKGDLANFKRLTMGHTILMGRKTFESLPRLLPGRNHAVLSRDPDFNPDGVTVLRSPEEAAALPPNTFIIGGASVYERMLPLADTCILTKIDAAAPAADAYFPDIDADPQWICTEASPPMLEEGVRYTFCTYRRRG